MQHTSLNKQQNTKAYKFLNQAASKSFMLLSLFLLLVPIARLSCGTAAGKHLDGGEGAGEDAAALVFLRFLGVEGVDAAPTIFFISLVRCRTSIAFLFLCCPFLWFLRFRYFLDFSWSYDPFLWLT
jgi:hypothetical protein